MKKMVSVLGGLALLVGSAGTTYAWDVNGTVLCAGSGAPLVGVNVTVSGNAPGCGGAFSQNATTDSTGHYLIPLPPCAGTFNVCVDTSASALGPGATVSPSACVGPFSTDQNDQVVGISWTVTGGTCGGAPPPVSANCVTIVATVNVPIAPVTVTGSGGCGGPYTFSATGLPNGLTMDSSGTISGTPTVSGTFNYTVTVTDHCGTTGTVNCSVTVSPTPPPCPGCVDPSLGLGAAAGCTVLELKAAQVSITGPAGGLLGDICIAPNGKLSMSGSEYITGNIELGAGATFNNSSSGSIGAVIHNVDLSAQINAAYAANVNDAGLACSQSFTTLDGKSVTTITGGHGVNVICVGDVVLSGKQILLTGPSDAKFVINVTGKFVLTGGGLGPQIRVDSSAGIAPSAVVYNIIGSGPDVAFSGGGGGVNCCAAIVDGTLLAPYRKIALSPGLVNGEVISGLDISIVSGSSVRCPPPCP